MPFKFEKLRVWQMSLKFATEIHKMSSIWPEDEKFNLTSQIRRAADSISLNIAEGSTGQTNKQFQKFLGYSIRSGVEVVGCLYLARERNYITQDIFQEHYKNIDELVKSIQALRKSL